MAVKKKKKKKKIRKEQRRVEKGKIYILATFNNTLLTITDVQGNTVCWGSSGTAGFKGARKSTPFAATATINKVISKARVLGLREVEVFIKGPGPGRDAVLRVLRNSRLKVSLIADVTPIPHNGCRPKKKRRG